MVKITITHLDGAETKYSLDGKMFTVGRAKDNAIVLPDGSSSGHHAVLKRASSGNYSLTDLGSTNHTKVNGKKIQTMELVDGDRILFGDTLAIYASDIVDPNASTRQLAESSPSTKKAPDGKKGPSTSEPNAIDNPRSAPNADERPATRRPRPARDEESGGGGCFAILMFPLLALISAFAGLSAAHYQQTDGEYLHDYLIRYAQNHQQPEASE